MGRGRRKRRAEEARQGVSPKTLDLGSLPITELLLLASYPTM
jgi:hypothetical protein